MGYTIWWLWDRRRNEDATGKSDIQFAAAILAPPGANE